MGGVVDKVMDDWLGFDSGKDAANAARAAAGRQAAWQQQALDYLKEKEQLPSEARDKALTQLMDYSGANGIQDQTAAIDQLKTGGIYQALMGNRRYGEDAIMRNAAATGGLRSGNIQQALYDYNTRYANDALLRAFATQMSGLGGLANLPSYARDIANMTAGIGQTLAQGDIAHAQGIYNQEQQNLNMAGSFLNGLIGGFF